MNELATIDKTPYKAEYVRRNLKRFIQEFWPTIEPAAFVAGYHVDAICDHLANIKDIRNLAIAMPPRCSKSLIIATLFPCWFWASHPQTRFICSSYSIQLAERDNVKARNLISSDLYKSYYGHVFKLSEDENTKRRFSNDKTGFRLCTSIDGSNTGEGGEIIIADDLHSVQESESKASRDSVIRWFATVWPTRLNDPKTGCRILVGQMIHHEDVLNYLIRNDEANNWTKLILPLEAGKSKFVSTRWHDTREPGELLCPERIPAREVTFLKSTLGKRAFESQYNQNPSPPEDAIFKPEQIKHYEGDSPEGGMRIAAVDLAISQTGDFTVIVTADIYPDGSIYLVNVLRERMTGPKLVPAIKAIHAIYNPTIIYIEDVAFQRLIIQEARLQGLPVKPVRPEGDKVSRSVMLQVKLEAGQLYLPKEKSWVDDFVSELSEFPNAKHDDQVDAASYVAIQANLIYRRLSKPKQEMTPEERAAKAAKDHEDRMKRALTEGLF